MGIAHTAKRITEKADIRALKCELGIKSGNNPGSSNRRQINRIKFSIDREKNQWPILGAFFEETYLIFKKNCGSIYE